MNEALSQCCRIVEEGVECRGCESECDVLELGCRGCLRQASQASFPRGLCVSVRVCVEQLAATAATTSLQGPQTGVSLESIVLVDR